MTSVGVIAHGGKELGGGLALLRESLRRHGIDDPLWRQVPKSKFAPKQVGKLIDDGVDLLFVWGGDGMVQRCVDAVGKAPVTLAIVPAGTANLFASNLGIPKDLEQAVEIGLNGPRRTLDVGSVNGERFAVMAGTGFDAAMIRGADGGMKDRLGRFSYVVTGMRGHPARRGQDARRGRRHAVVQGDRRRACWSATWATCSAGISAFPDARPDDGRLDVAVVTAESFLDWARTLGRTAAGDPAASPFVETTTAEKIDMRPRQEVARTSSTAATAPRPSDSKIRREARGDHRVRSREEGRTMSTANLVPETWELTGDDAKETLERHRPQGSREGRVHAPARRRRLQPRPIDGVPADPRVRAGRSSPRWASPRRRATAA